MKEPWEIIADNEKEWRVEMLSQIHELRREVKGLRWTVAKISGGVAVIFMFGKHLLSNFFKGH